MSQLWKRVLKPIDSGQPYECQALKPELLFVHNLMELLSTCISEDLSRIANAENKYSRPLTSDDKK